MNPLMRDFHTTEIGVGFRYAFGEQFSQIGRGAIITTHTFAYVFVARSPRSFIFSRRKIALYQSQYQAGIQCSKRFNFGETFINLSAGKIWGDVPYPYLYSMAGAAETPTILFG